MKLILVKASISFLLVGIGNEVNAMKPKKAIKKCEEVLAAQRAWIQENTELLSIRNFGLISEPKIETNGPKPEFPVEIIDGLSLIRPTTTHEIKNQCLKMLCKIWCTQSLQLWEQVRSAMITLVLNGADVNLLNEKDDLDVSMAGYPLYIALKQQDPALQIFLFKFGAQTDIPHLKWSIQEAFDQFMKRK